MIKILIVDDSKTETRLFQHLFQAEADMEVIACAKDGKEGVRLTQELRPDIITMDIHMPLMNGFEAIKLIMSQVPTPIVVISSTVNDKELNTTFLALEAGALSVIEKPTDIHSPNFLHYRKHMINTIRSMSEIKVIRRRFPANEVKVKSKKIHIPNQFVKRNFEIVAIGTSVGGPEVLKTILSQLPATFPVPIVIVQHMSPGFILGFTRWLNEHIALQVKCAEDAELLMPGTVYFAPDQHHLEIIKNSGQLKTRLTQNPPVSGFCPSATTLIKSVALCSKEKAVGILLTGMGDDGALGLLALKEAQGLTLIQDAESTVVFGMAGVAKSLGAVDEVVKLNEFSDYLKQLFDCHDEKALV